MDLQLDQIEIGERFRKDYGDVDELAADIKKNGLITPIAVALTENVDFGGKTDKPYVLLAGGRRTAAMLKLGMTSAPVRLYKRKLNHLEMRTIELAENLIRKDLDYAERARLLERIDELQVEIHGPKISTSPDAPGWSQRDTAALVDRNPMTVSQDIQLAKAMKQFPELQLDQCKNRAEALKRLKNVTKMVAADEGARQYTESMKEDILFNKLSNAFMVGDFFEVVKQIPPSTIDIVELDPPYGIDLPKVKKDNECLFYNEVPSKEYEEFMVATLKECYRIMKEGSWLALWFAQDPWFESIARWVEDAGFKMNRIPAIWVKPQGQTAQPETFMGNSYEPFFYARKGKAKLNKPGRSNVFQFNAVPHTRKYHPTQRPLDLISEVLETLGRPGANVFVPFLGSGNTILAAHSLQMTAIGTDLSEQFKSGYIMQLKELLK